MAWQTETYKYPSAVQTDRQRKGKVIDMTLDMLPIGKQAVITAVGGEGALRCRLLDMGLIPGCGIVICKIAPMGDPLELRLRGYQLTIRKEDAKKIEVEPKETM